ncbi:MAG: methylated-DNA--[protein]-cysteine S-methyltransferase [Saprospiraceae bacterium]|nr:methylated-DNA--[protein]-cysteine S-methyltransferase [Saprospiraceae bacterium]
MVLCTETSKLTSVHIVSYVSPIGDLWAAATDQGICYLEFKEEDIQRRQLEAFCIKWELEVKEQTNESLELLVKQLDEYFHKTIRQFDLPLHLLGTEFQQKVWIQLLQIPFGQTISYEKLSLKMEQPLAIRAIANANGQNPIAILVPCHRVIGKDGSLTGYAGGMWRKQWLLEHESNLPKQSKLFFG